MAQDLHKGGPMPVAGKKTKVINTKLAGVSHTNPDGTERQDIIKDLKMGD